MKATNVASSLGRVNVKRLPADAQRSLAQRINAWAAQYGVDIEEEKPTPRIASPIKPIATTHKEKPMPKLDLEAIVTRVVAEAMASIVTEPTPIKRAPKAKANTFFEDVIVAHAKAKTHTCKVKGCYKYGKSFTDAGWLGNGTNKGHIQISPFHR